MSKPNKPFCEFCFSDDCDHCEKLKAYKQGREDAIDTINRKMYHEAFEADHEVDGMQKWDSGNWIRYKLFEKVIEQIEKGDRDA